MGSILKVLMAVELLDLIFIGVVFFLSLLDSQPHMFSLPVYLVICMDCVPPAREGLVYHCHGFTVSRSLSVTHRTE